ncbi:MAG: iron-containing alcohol dehydrogenase, partial [Salinivirgaceae bacterium]
MTFTASIADTLSAYLLNNTFSSVFVVTDENVYKNCFTAIDTQKQIDTKNVFILAQGENTKNIDTCIFIWSELNRLGADRKSLIINLGGGMITDLGGFIASTYKRGIRFINIPTQRRSAGVGQGRTPGPVRRVAGDHRPRRRPSGHGACPA